MEPFEEHVHQLATSDRVPCFAGQHFKVADVLVDVWEVEGETVEAGLSYLLLSGIGELGLKSGQEVRVSVLDVVVDRVQLFESFEYSLYPAVNLWAFDEGECDRYAPDGGFESRHPLVGHHVDSKFADECVGAGSVAIEEQRGYSSRFKISDGVDGNEMSGGYSCRSGWSPVGIVWSSWPAWAPWAIRSSWCSSEGDVEHVVDMLRVLVLDWVRRVVSSRYNGLRDRLGVHRQGLCRHSEATVRVCSDGSSLVIAPFSVWASWAVCFDNRS